MSLQSYMRFKTISTRSIDQPIGYNHKVGQVLQTKAEAAWWERKNAKWYPEDEEWNQQNLLHCYRSEVKKMEKDFQVSGLGN